MSAALRIYRGDKPAGGMFEAATQPSPSSPPKPSPDQYLGRVVKMIPSEVVAAYLVGAGVIPPDNDKVLAGWSVVCLLALVIRARLTRDPERGKGAQWLNVLLAAVAYVIWIYNLGGPFRAYGMYVPYVGTLMLVSWTLFVPLVYDGD